MSHFNTYGRMAEADVDDIIQNGRYYAQQEAEQYIPADVMKKLDLQASDSFVDIGCGMGINLREALKRTKDCSACDHSNIVGKLQKNSEFKDVKFYDGSFLDIDFGRQFSKVLIYCVAPALPDEETLLNFCEKGVSIMQKDGLMLLGDLSNIDKKKRFLDSERGKRFQEEWENNQKKTDADNPTASYIEPGDEKAVTINDDTVFKILQTYRSKGFHTYLLDQPQNLPFGNTREDIVIVGPEYQN